MTLFAKSFIGPIESFIESITNGSSVRLRAFGIQRGESHRCEVILTGSVRMVNLTHLITVLSCVQLKSLQLEDFMYCPNCGQQQMSDEMRFCSRCGIALSGLAEWLAGSHLPRERVDNTSIAASPRRKGIRRAAKIMFFSAVLFPVFLMISFVVNHGEPMIVPTVIFFVSLVMMLYARLFSDKTAPVNNQVAQTSTLNSSAARGSLPPAANNPLPGFGRQRVRTNDLAQPPSVIENTTRLLDNE
jgi:hypothetical protein